MSMQRLNFFRGQFLKVIDFDIEQEYQIQMSRLHNRLFHTSGILEGLSVTGVSGMPAVTVDMGTALDLDGKLLVLDVSTEVDFSAETASAGAVSMIRYLSIYLQENEANPSTDSGYTGNTRINEDIVFEISIDLPDTANNPEKIGLAQITLTVDPATQHPTGVSAIDTSLQKIAGAVAGESLTISRDPSAVFGNQALRVDGDSYVTGNVGIGTHTPSEKLDVAGKIRVSDELIINTDSPQIKFDDNNAGNWFIHVNEGNMFFIREPWEADNLFLHQSGNVGIGTTTPGEKLEVIGTAKVNYLRLNYRDDISLGGELQFLGAGSNPSWEMGVEENRFRILRGGERLTVLSDGNVGVGTTAPVEKLDVIGNLKVSGTLYVQNDIPIIRFSDTNNNNKYWDIHVNDGKMYFIHDGLVDSLILAENGNAGIGTATPAEKLDVNGTAQIGLLKVKPQDAVTEGGEIQLLGAGSNPDWYLDLYEDRFRIHAQGLGEKLSVLSDGNVGIGTDAPGYKLEVAGDVCVGESLAGVADTAEKQGYGAKLHFAGAVDNSDPMWMARYNESSDKTHLRINLSDDSGTGDSLQIGHTSGATFNSVLNIGASGNVGIGTTTPGATLDVKGDIMIGASDHQAVFYKPDVPGTKYWFKKGHTASSSDLMIIDNDGNVGIGTTAPVATLDVNGKARIHHDNFSAPGIGVTGGSGTRLVLYPGNDTITPFAFGINTAELWSGVPAGANHQWYVGTDSKMILNSSGNVGIGTDAPAAKLDVNGTAQVGLLKVKPQDAVTEGGEIQLLGAGSYPDWYLDLYEDRFRIHTQELGEKFSVLSDGNVGIGTDAPGYKLEVAGDVCVGESLAGVADTAEKQGYGAKLHFAGAVDNSDPMWMARYNESSDKTHLRINLSDDSGTGDSLQVGYTSGATFNSVVEIGASGNVGIGTTAPAAKLDVKGSADLTLTGTVSTTTGTNTVTGTGTIFNTELWVGMPIKIGAHTYTVASITDATNLTLAQNALETLSNQAFTTSYGLFRVQNTTGQVELGIDKNGNVGIGTTTPGHKLDVNGITQVGYLMVKPQNSSDGGEIQLQGAGSNPAWYLDAYDSRFRIHAHGLGEKLTISSDGNVGIGTTAPTEKLDIIGGSIRIQDANDGGWIKAVDDHHGIYMRENNTDQTNYYEYGGNLAENKGHRFYTGGLKGDQTLRLQIANDGTYIDGNVGIGTPAPSEKLEVIGTAKMNYLRLNPRDEIRLGGELQFLGAGSNPSWEMSVEDNRFRILRGGERLTVLSDGNVGIGTTAPRAQLNIRENAFFRLTGTLATNVNDSTIWGTGTHFKTELWIGAKIRIGNNDYDITDVINDSSFTVYQVPGVESSNLTAYRVDPLLTVAEIAETAYFQVNSGGNVGIGTGNPGQKFVIEGDCDQGTHSGNRMLHTGVLAIKSNEPQIDFIDTDVDAKNWAIHVNAGRMIFVREPWVDTNLTLAENGNVGIGTVNPTYKLHVVGSTYTTTSWDTASDLHWKKNITPLKNSLRKILKLQGVHYHWRKSEFPDKGFDERLQVGLIAQEVEKVFPELVSTGQDGYKALSYDKGFPILVEGIKEQQAQIETLASQNREQQTVIDQYLQSQKGADFAEYFKSADGKEIKPGTAVVMDEGLIRPAKKGETPFGVISANPRVLGGVYNEWPQKFLTDEFGNDIIEEYEKEIMVQKTEKVKRERQKVKTTTIEEEVTQQVEKKVKGKKSLVEVKKKIEREIEEPQFEEVEIFDEETKELIRTEKVPVMETYEAQEPIFDANGKPVMLGSGKLETRRRAKINPDYDPDREYTPRDQRPEWNVVGLLGQLPLRKNQPTAPGWLKIKELSDKVELWLVK